MTLGKASPALSLFTQFDDSCFGTDSKDIKRLVPLKIESPDSQAGHGGSVTEKSSTSASSILPFTLPKHINDKDSRIRTDSPKSHSTAEKAPVTVSRRRPPPELPLNLPATAPVPQVLRLPFNDLYMESSGAATGTSPTRSPAKVLLPAALYLLAELRLPLPVMNRSLDSARRFSEQLLPDRLLCECMSLSDHLEIYKFHLKEVTQSLLEALEDESDTIVRDLYRCITEIESSVPFNTVIIARAQNWVWCQRQAYSESDHHIK